MSTRLRMLVLWSIATSACIGSRPDESGLDAGEARSSRPSAEPSRTAPSPPLDPRIDAGASHTRRDAGHFTRRDGAAADVLDVQNGTDEDAGSAELAESIELDCRETLRCNSTLGKSLDACVASVTDALASAPPDARERFRAIILRCQALRACAYVSCAETR